MPPRALAAAINPAAESSGAATGALQLTVAQVIPVPIPHDCVDGFLGAYWRRPRAYLNADTRRGISSFAACRDLSPLQRLEEHLDTGEWHRRYGELLEAEELDIGYRLVVGRPR